jgi:hypothetical protein
MWNPTVYGNHTSPSSLTIDAKGLVTAVGASLTSAYFTSDVAASEKFMQLAGDFANGTAAAPLLTTYGPGSGTYNAGGGSITVDAKGRVTSYANDLAGWYATTSTLGIASWANPSGGIILTAGVANIRTVNSGIPAFGTPDYTGTNVPGTLYSVGLIKPSTDYWGNTTTLDVDGVTLNFTGGTSFLRSTNAAGTGNHLGWPTRTNVNTEYSVYGYDGYTSFGDIRGIEDYTNTAAKVTMAAKESHTATTTRNNSFTPPGINSTSVSGTLTLGPFKFRVCSASGNITGRTRMGQDHTIYATIGAGDYYTVITMNGFTCYPGLADDFFGLADHTTPFTATRIFLIMTHGFAPGQSPGSGATNYIRGIILD